MRKYKIWFAGTASLIVEIFNSLFYNISKKLVRLNDRIEKRLTPESDAKMAETNIAYAIDLLPEHEATSKEKQILKGIYKRMAIKVMIGWIVIPISFI